MIIIFILQYYYLWFLTYSLKVHDAENVLLCKEDKHKIDIFYNKKNHGQILHSNDMIFLHENAIILIYDGNSKFKVLLVYIKNNKNFHLLHKNYRPTLLSFIFYMKNTLNNNLSLFLYKIEYDFCCILVK